MTLTSNASIGDSRAVEPYVSSPGRTPAGPLPNPSIRYLPGMVVGFWTLLGLIEAGNAYLVSRASGAPLPWWLALARNLPWWWLWAALTPVVAWTCRAFPLSGGAWRRSVLPHLLAGLSISAIHISAAGTLLVAASLRTPPTPPAEAIRRLIQGYALLDIITWLAIVAAWQALDYHARFVSGERSRLELLAHAARLESQASEARLSALRRQLNPHFLFNTLHTVSALVRRDERQPAIRTLSNLGDLLRVTLADDRAEAPLADELDFLNRYLAIEQERFRERLTVEIDVPDAALDALVPTLILQPLVENAIRHGIGREVGPGRITVRARVEAERLTLEVRDTGRDTDVEASVDGEGTGVGLANTRKRLREMYGDEARLTLEGHPDGGTRALVRVPLRWADAPEFEGAESESDSPGSAGRPVPEPEADHVRP